MAGHRPFRTLRDPIMADPVRRARVEEMGRASRILIALARLLDSQCDTPEGTTATADTAELRPIRIEEEDSEFLSTLKEGIEELGGRLEVAATFPDRTIQLLG